MADLNIAENNLSSKKHPKLVVDLHPLCWSHGFPAMKCLPISP